MSEESDIDLLRRKADVLETENERLSRRVTSLLRELMLLKGMAPEQVALNLPGLLSRAAEKPASRVTKPGSERRARPDDAPNKAKDAPPQTGHGPTPQLDLRIAEETFDLDAADKICTSCGGGLEEWVGQDDKTEVVDVVERHWVLKKCTLKKYRCKCGGCVETADGPERLVPGGRYTPDVALSVATGKYLDQLPLERQVAMAKRQGARLTTQALWDQLFVLSNRMTPLYERIRALILEQPVIGVDESPFKLLKKGGAVKWQAWQMSCPLAVYFEILPTKSAEVGKKLLGSYSGEVVADGARTYESLARDGPWRLSNCWSHGRRRVLAAEGEAPGQVAEFLDLVGELYAVERKSAREPEDGDLRRGYRHRIDVEQLRSLRDTESRAIIKRIQTWMLLQQCIPGGELKAALAYIAQRWTALTRFLDNPLIPLDNNQTEAGYVWLAIGRRNYIGARSVRGTEVAAKFYTIFESARLCGANPEAYLRYAAKAISSGAEPLLPHEWVSKG